MMTLKREEKCRMSSLKCCVSLYDYACNAAHVSWLVCIAMKWLGWWLLKWLVFRERLSACVLFILYVAWNSYLKLIQKWHHQRRSYLFCLEKILSIMTAPRESCWPARETPRTGAQNKRGTGALCLRWQQSGWRRNRPKACLLAACRSAM